MSPHHNTDVFFKFHVRISGEFIYPIQMVSKEYAPHFIEKVKVLHDLESFFKIDPISNFPPLGTTWSCFASI